jgi:AcrR family transcriptional regulator/predicted RNA-binding Zn ribbon-like protein
VSTHTRILDAADRLFTEQGIRAIGVDAIVAAADTAKTTLYAHFGSKDGLVVAYLQRRAARRQERLEQGLAAHRGSPVERVLHLYDLLAVELAEPGYRGSPFANACVELGADHPAAAVAREHRQWLLDTFTDLTTDLTPDLTTGPTAPDPAALAAQLLLLHEAAAQAAGDAAATARAAAAALLATHRRGAPRSTTDTPASPPAAALDRRAVERNAEATAPRAAAGLPAPAPHFAGGSPEAHRLVAFLNTAHLPDGDDQLADERAGPWLEQWLAEAGAPTPDELAPPPAELLALREGLRQLAAVNCGAEADAAAVADAEAVLRRAPLLVDLAAGGEPRLTPTSATSGGLAIAVAATAYLAVRARGEWPRLKVCGSPDCRWAFVDTTRNRSRRWCAMAGCGNRAKNRAWRDRQTLVTSK